MKEMGCTIYGDLLSVTEYPSYVALIHTIQDEIISATFDISLIENLKKRIGTEVGLKGTTEWQITEKGYERINFHIEKLLSYRKTDIVTAFKHLREMHEICGSPYNNIDANEYVNKIRGYDEEK